MTTKQTTARLGTLLFMLPLVSIFLWAGFDIKWWVDTSQDVNRSFVLFMLHAFFIAVGAALFLFGVQNDN